MWSLGKRFGVLALLMAFGLAAGAFAQVNPPVASNVPPPLAQQPSPFGGKYGLFVGGSYQFAQATSANGVPIATTNVAGGQVGVLIHFTDHNAMEARYAVASPLQAYGTSLRVQARDTTFSLDYVRVLAPDSDIHPFFLGGLSVVNYSPSGGNNTPGASSQKRVAIDYGAGLDWRIAKHFSLRFEYRALIYRVPDFSLITVHKWNHMPVPDAGILFHF